MDSSTLIQHSLTGQPYGYSAADLSDLGASEYTLVTIVVDESGSTAGFKDPMEKCIRQVVDSCKLSPRSDYLMIRLVAFDHNMREIHGFKMLGDCDLTDYDDCLRPGGSTLLFESAQNAIQATAAYGKDLDENDYAVNAIVFIITDGMDNESGSITSASVGDALKQAMMDEHLESIMSVLIGVGVGHYAGVSTYLDDFKNDAGFDQYVEIKDADKKTLAKLGGFISQSVVSQSSSLGTGSKSQKLQF